MSKHHPTLCAIGNGIVDLEFQVSEQFLSDFNLSKGSMSLVEARQQDALLAELKQRFGLVKKSAGGSAANSVVLASQLGSEASYLCQLGKDDLGDFYQADLANQGVTFLGQRHNTKTGRCLVLVTPDGERTLITCLAANRALSTSSLVAAVRQVDWLFLEGYLVGQEQSFALIKQVVQQARQDNQKVALSFSDPSVVSLFADRLSLLLGPNLDLVFMNQQEARQYTRQDDLQAVARDLHQQVESLVITCHDQGAMVSQRQQAPIFSRAIKTSLVDSNGAGDAFAGAFLFGILNDWPIQQTALLANTLAAQVVSQFGARLSQQAVAETLKRLQPAQAAC